MGRSIVARRDGFGAQWVAFAVAVGIFGWLMSPVSADSSRAASRTLSGHTRHRVTQRSATSIDLTTVAAPARLSVAARTMAVVGRIHANLRTARYEHVIDVDERRGRYVFDCSGLTAWVFARTAPAAHATIMRRTNGSRPLARDYYRAIAAAEPGRAAGSWLRVGRVEDAREGDVVAWLRPAIVRSNNTGHVAIIVAAPERLANTDAWLVRIADSSRYRHENDSRENTGRTGFGFGSILVVADPASGAPVAYGWFGRHSSWVLRAQMAIGRAIR